MPRKVEFSEGYYHPNIEKLKAGNFNVRHLQSEVGAFLEERAAMKYQNGRITRRLSQSVRSEIDEGMFERSLYGTKGYSSRAERSEGVDVAFLSLGMAIARDISLDPYKIMPRVNGVGNKDSVFDLLAETAGNVEERTLSPDVHQLIAYLIAYMAGIPESFDISLAMDDVLHKNRLNYPEKFFNGVHPISQRLLSQEELPIQYGHSRKCLKMIRFLHRKLLNHKEKDYGIDQADWSRYEPWLNDFENSDLAVSQLAILLERDYSLTPVQALFMREEVNLVAKADTKVQQEMLHSSC